MQRTHQRIEHLILTAILAGYALVGGLYAVYTPPWQAPDEPAHYNYIAGVAANGCCPVIEMGDWDAAYLDQLKAAKFAPTLTNALDTIQYEDHQPPLYYLLAAPVYRLTGGALTALRLLSVVLGAGVVLCAYAITRQMLPARRGAALSAAALAAFIPQHVAILASVNNDALAYLLTAVGLLLCARYLGERGEQPGAWQLTVWAFIGGCALFAVVTASAIPLNRLSVALLMPPLFAGAGYAAWRTRTDRRTAYHVMLGAIIGAAFLTKTTVYFLVGIVTLAVLLRPVVLAAESATGRGAGVALRVADELRKIPLPGVPESVQKKLQQRTPRLGWSLLQNAREVYAPVFRRHSRKLRRALYVVLGIAFVFGAGWWGRNLMVYGFPDALGLAAHDAVVVGQLRTSERIAQVGWGGYWGGALRTTFNSFWGQLGWMALPLPANWYTGIGALVALAGAGLLIDSRRATRPPRARAVTIGVLLGLTGLAAAAQFALYNLSFYQVQGRYLFVALVPFVMLLAAGLDGWARLLTGQHRATAYAPYLPPLALAAVFGAANLWLLRFVVPALAP